MVRKQHHSTRTTLRQTHQVCCWPVDAKKIHVVCGARYFYRSHPQLVCLLEVFRFRVERKRRRYSPTRPLKAHFFCTTAKSKQVAQRVFELSMEGPRSPRRFGTRLICLQLRTQLGKEKRRRSRFQRPSSYLAPQLELELSILRLRLRWIVHSHRSLLVILWSRNSRSHPNQS